MSSGTGKDALDDLARRIQSEGLLAPLWPSGDGIAVLDQTRLPFERAVLMVRTPGEMRDAIRSMQVRGSGAIGCAGALGAYLAVASAPHAPETWGALAAPVKSARPTALALSLAVDEVLAAARMATHAGGETASTTPVEAAAVAAAAFFTRQLDMERAIGRYGAAVIPDGATVLTHCHSGALAGAGYGGRALSVIRSAAEAGKHIRVIAQETRPYLQGARITAWELHQLGIPVTLITHGMSGALMQQGRVDVCVVGSDRLALNGDLVNKVGTYLVALAAREHAVPFYTATTRYNVDPNCPNGEAIPMEFRPAGEVLAFNGRPITFDGAEALYPAFDITPARLLAGIITETGVLRPPFESQLAALSKEH